METKCKLAIFIFLVQAIGNLAEGDDCIWDKDLDYPQHPPLILDSSNHLVMPVLEGDQRIIRIPSGFDLTLSCPGREITMLGLEGTRAKCAGGKSVNIEGTDYNIVELGCTKDISETIHRDVGTCGDRDIGIYEIIGFDVTITGDFFDPIYVCFDPASETNLFSMNTIHGVNIAAKDVDPGRPMFKASTGFFSVSMAKVYTKVNQLALMKKLLGDDELAAKIIDSGKQFYFAKGHMAPDADFVTVAEQDATYYYINALPQWQSINNGNWKYVETSSRDLAEEHGTDLTIYSGGWGVLELDDINGNPVEIYLGLLDDKKVAPVPALSWKVVYEKDTNRGAAIVCSNNPHITEPPKPLCDNICSKLQWLDFDFDDLDRGYTYCCTVEDLRAAIPHIPDLGNVELLDY